MKLLEYESKALLARHGVPLARGAIWPEVPESESGWVVKAQVLAGGRGKKGGILMAANPAQLKQHATALQGGRLGDEPIHAVYIEQKLDIEREFYLAAFVNRDEGRVNVMASAAGGVDIEQVPKSQVVTIVVDPLIGLAAFQVQQLRRALQLDGDAGRQFESLVTRTVATLIDEDAELVEINPVIQTRAGQLVAADAKIVLDDDAVSRHPARGSPVAWSSDSAFMQRCRELDTIGVDNRSRIGSPEDACGVSPPEGAPALGRPGGGVPAPRRPNVAILCNGAGMTMATYDQVSLSGVDVAGAIELHGALARGVEHTASVISALFMLEADVVFINGFYQLRSCDALAKALVMALDGPGAPDRSRVVTRMRGLNAQTSREILEAARIFYSPSLTDATDKVLSLAASMAADGGNAP